MKVLYGNRIKVVFFTLSPLTLLAPTKRKLCLCVKCLHNCQLSVVILGMSNVDKQQLLQSDISTEFHFIILGSQHNFISFSFKG